METGNPPTPTPSKDEKKTVLACFEKRKREVIFSAGEDELQALIAAVKMVYNDVLPVGMKPVVQLKHEEWGGEFLDVKEGSIIPDKSVIQIVFENEVNHYDTASLYSLLCI